jgi:drug/metabolite transporter (DMT)-like permease
VLASLAAALAAAFCYGIGAVMQAIAVRAASRRPVLAAAGVSGGVDPSLVIRMFRQWLFVVSLLIDFAGFICQLIALRRLPIFEVQVIIAANLAVTAVFASWLMHTVLSIREWAAVISVVVGVGLLGSSAGAEGATKVGIDFHLALIAALAAISVLGIAAARLPNPFRTPALGAVAGLGYGVLAVCARILPGFTPVVLIKSPAAYTLAAAGIISFMLYASALESGSVTVATAAVILLETVPPALVGVLFLGDKTRPGMTGPAIAGFILALLSAIALARFGEAGVNKDEQPPAPRAAVVVTSTSSAAPNPAAGSTVATRSTVATGSTVAAEVTAELTVDLTDDLRAEGRPDREDKDGSDNAGAHGSHQASSADDGPPAPGQRADGTAESSAELPSGRKN